MVLFSCEEEEEERWKCDSGDCYRTSDGLFYSFDECNQIADRQEKVEAVIIAAVMTSVARPEKVNGENLIQEVIIRSAVAQPILVLLKTTSLVLNPSWVNKLKPFCILMMATLISRSSRWYPEQPSMLGVNACSQKI